MLVRIPFVIGIIVGLVIAYKGVTGFPQPSLPGLLLVATGLAISAAQVRQLLRLSGVLRADGQSGQEIHDRSDTPRDGA